ncbi:hypothetical protein [Stappia sp. ES.058]|nr:hypothetical protein [Stappia sp. ES.058]SDT98920.1 hypothetical protein SAMN05428979_0946 [Stappia sp. ES.058]
MTDQPLESVRMLMRANDASHPAHRAIFSHFAARLAALLTRRARSGAQAA